MNRKTLVRAALIFAAALVTTASVWYGYRRWRASSASLETELPTFTEPSAGLRAPLSEGFGFAIGRMSLQDTEARLQKLGLTCKDTSIRALMRAMREKKKAEAEERKARGEEVDAVSGASANRPSKRERNPQVRLSCEDISSSVLTDRSRVPSTGRMLLVFDSPTHPLRHTSFRRNHMDHAKALADVQQTVEALKKVFGEPTKSVGELPVEVDGKVEFPHLSPYSREWHFADLHVKIEAMELGRRGVSIGEDIEVPWPVRPDAPALPVGAGRAAATGSPVAGEGPAAAAPGALQGGG